MGVSENRGTPKSSIYIGISIISHPFWGIPTFDYLWKHPYVSMINPPNASRSPPFSPQGPFRWVSLAALATKGLQTPGRSSKGRAASMGTTGGTCGRLGEDGQVLFVNLQS